MKEKETLKTEYDIKIKEMEKQINELKNGLNIKKNEKVNKFREEYDMKSYSDEIVEYALKNNENDKKAYECLKKINDFRGKFNLNIKDYPDEKIMKLLIENEYDEEITFAKLFGEQIYFIY